MTSDEKIYVLFLLMVGVLVYTNSLSLFSVTLINER